MEVILNRFFKTLLSLSVFACLLLPVQGSAQESAVPKQGTVFVEPLVDMSFVYIEPGTFMMGTPETEVDRFSDERLHEVEIKKGFWMGQYEVTFDQYDAFVEATRRSKAYDWDHWGRGNRPVIYVKWFYAHEFAKWLSKETGYHYRLPTEAEWEYAARAGTTTAFSFGEHVGGMANHSWFKRLLDVNKSQDDADAQKLLMDGYAWYGENAGQKTHPVGEKKPNPWGLYDMHGNVWEWTGSVYTEDYDGSELRYVENLKSNEKRSVRGGAWSFYAKGMRSGDRRFFAPVNRLDDIGFRLVRED